MIFNTTRSCLRTLATQLLLLAGLGLLPVMATQAAEMSVPARLAERSLLMDVVRANDRLVTVGERGHILVSDDNGQSWRQKDVPTRTLLTSVFFIDEHKGWAVGHDQTILYSADSGETWQLQHEDTSDDLPFFDIWFADANHGIAIGAYALYMVTGDGGQSWQPVPFSPDFGDEDSDSPEEDITSSDDEASDSLNDYVDDEEELPPFDYHLMRFAVADSGAIYIAAEAGDVFRSDDHGKSWQSLPSPYEGSFFGVTTLSGDELLLYGLRGNLFRSEDAGQNWTQIVTETKALLSSGVVLKDGMVLVGGAGGVVLVSDDTGQSFKLWCQKDGKDISAFSEVAPGKVAASSTGGVKVIDLSTCPK